MSGAHPLDRILELGRAAFPDIAVSADRLAPVIRQRLDGEEAPADVVADEIYLAAACAVGDPTALATFERLYFGAIAPALSRLSLGRDEVAEVAQILRIRLFVAGAGELPRVITYAGQGQLGALVRVAAVRAGLNVLRDGGRLDRDADGFEDIPVGSDDPELARAKSQHRAAFKAAFAEAVATLEPRERSVLRLTFVNRLGIDKISTMYGVHRSTAARWIAHARANLTGAVHRRLGERLGVRSAELDQIVPLLESQLELSLERLLKSSAEAGDR